MIYALIVTVVLAFKVVWDYIAKTNGRIISHSRSALIDVSVYVFSAGLLFYPDVMNIAGAVVLACGYRWIAFDILFNLANKDKWDHYGTSSKLDLLMTKAGKYHLLIKAVPIAIGLTLCLV